MSEEQNTERYALSDEELPHLVRSKLSTLSDKVSSDGNDRDFLLAIVGKEDPDEEGAFVSECVSCGTLPTLAAALASYITSLSYKQADFAVLFFEALRRGFEEDSEEDFSESGSPNIELSPTITPNKGSLH